MTRPIDQRILEILRRVGLCLHVPVDASMLDLGDLVAAQRDATGPSLLQAGARRAGIFIKETQLDSSEVLSLVWDGFPVIVASDDGHFWVFEKALRGKIEACEVNDAVRFHTLSRRQLRALMTETARFFVAKKELECSELSHPPSHHGSTGHTKPQRRFLAMLRLDARDVWTISLFALVAGLLSLATPLAIESLVNVVSWGTYLQPLLILALMLLACLGISGILRILQTVVVEMIQRRQFVRIVGDLSHRFPRADQAAFVDNYPRELANRVFDIMTIQKASAVLLLDGITIVLTTILGMLLLAFYHPFLLGFDLVLLLSMIIVTRVLGRGGVQSAIEESIVKYEVAHWLQDVIASPAPFKVNGGELLAIERANRLTTEYIHARQRQFRVVIRQVAFAIGLQVIASTVLLGLGGWLVIRQQLTLGQLVASELVVTLVLSSFAKAGKSLEKFYDLMAGIDKVGHLLDIPVDPRYELEEIGDAPLEVRWEELSFHFHHSGITYHIPSAKIEAGERVAITGDDRSGKSTLLKCLAGLQEPQHGLAEIGGMSARHAALGGTGRMVGYAGDAQIFHAALHENIDLGRADVSQKRIRDVLTAVGLWDAVLRLPKGLNTELQTNGLMLTQVQRKQLSIAQAMAGNPKLLLVDGILDDLPSEVFEQVWAALTAPTAPWTLLAATNRDDLASRCSRRIDLNTHKTEHA